MCSHLMNVRWFASQTLLSTRTGPASLIHVPGSRTPGGKGADSWNFRSEREKDGKRAAKRDFFVVGGGASSSSSGPACSPAAGSFASAAGSGRRMDGLGDDCTGCEVLARE